MKFIRRRKFNAFNFYKLAAVLYAYIRPINFHQTIIRVPLYAYFLLLLINRDANFAAAHYPQIRKRLLRIGE